MEIKYWVKELLLYQSDYQILNDGAEWQRHSCWTVTSGKAVPPINGFQDTILINSLKFLPVQKMVFRFYTQVIKVNTKNQCCSS